MGGMENIWLDNGNVGTQILSSPRVRTQVCPLTRWVHVACCMPPWSTSYSWDSDKLARWWLYGIVRVQICKRICHIVVWGWRSVCWVRMTLSRGSQHTGWVWLSTMCVTLDKFQVGCSLSRLFMDVCSLHLASTWGLFSNEPGCIGSAGR